MPAAGPVAFAVALVLAASSCSSTSSRPDPAPPSALLTGRAAAAPAQPLVRRTHPLRAAAPPVAPDLRRLARAFVRYATGEVDVLPVATSVSLAIGGRTVVAIATSPPRLPDRRIWRTCPAAWSSYAAASCPVDLLGPIRNSAANGTRLVVSSVPGEVVCAPARSGPIPSGRLVVLRPAPARRSCAGDFALALVADRTGRLRRVDLTLSEP